MDGEDSADQLSGNSGEGVKIVGSTDELNANSEIRSEAFKTDRDAAIGQITKSGISGVPEQKPSEIADALTNAKPIPLEAPQYPPETRPDIKPIIQGLPSEITKGLADAKPVPIEAPQRPPNAPLPEIKPANS